MRTVSITAAAVLLMSACGSDDVLQPPAETPPPETFEPETDVTDPPTSPEPPSTAETSTTASDAGERSTTTEPLTTNETGSPTRDELASIAIDDLMTLIGAARSEIGVRSVEEVTWRDGSIGCPDPDFAYTQALVPGIRVVLDHDGFAYHYHQGGGRELFYCPTPAAPLETTAVD